MLSWFQGSKDVNALFARGQYAKAVKVLKRSLAEDPDSVHLRQLLADALARSGDEKQAVVVLHELVDEFAAEGFDAKAIALLKKIQRIDPDHPTTDSKLARLLKGDASGVFTRPELVNAHLESQPKPTPKRPQTMTSELVLSEEWFEEAVRGRKDFHWSPLLSDFSHGELEALIGGLRLLVKKAGSIVYSQGEPGESLFILASGWVRVYRRDERQHNEQIALLHEGQLFGEATVLTETARTETVIAAAESELLELDRETFENIAESHPGVRATVEDLYERRSLA